MNNYQPVFCIIEPEFFNDLILICNALNIEFFYEDAHIYIKTYQKDFFTINLNEYLKEQIEEDKEEYDNRISLTWYSYSLIILFILFFILTKSTNFPKWVQIGGNDAYLAINGRFYKAITALTLHNDIIHIFSNLFFFILLLKPLINILEEGRAWFFVIISGILGNILSDYIYQINHISIGFSTSVFATIGLLLSLNQYRNKLLPIGAGLGLFALTGTGENVDILAHFTGLISGVLLILLYKKKNFKIFNLSERFYKIFNIIFIIGAWILAYLFG